MSTAKEKVLTYFVEWCHSGYNLANGFEVYADKLRYKWVISTKVKNGKQPLSIVIINEPGNLADDFEFELAARILKLDPPQAAPIVWTHVADGGLEYWHSDCDKYSIDIYGNMSISAKYSIQDDRGIVCEWVLGDYVEVGEAFTDCQDHKQKQFNQLGGYNV